MKKTEILLENKDRFLRSLSKRQSPGGLARLGLGKQEFCGHATADGLTLYRGGRGIATLLGTTLVGRFEKRGEKTVLRCRFRRALPVALVWGLWCLLLLSAGLSLMLGTAFGEQNAFDVGAGAFLLAAGLLLALPLGLFSRREQARLLSLVEEIAALRNRQ